MAYLGELRPAEQVGWARVAQMVDHRPAPCLPLFDSTESNEPVPKKIEVCVDGIRPVRGFSGSITWDSLGQVRRIAMVSFGQPLLRMAVFATVNAEKSRFQPVEAARHANS